MFYPYIHRPDVPKAIITTHVLRIPAGNHIYTTLWGKIERSLVFLALSTSKHDSPSPYVAKTVFRIVFPPTLTSVSPSRAVRGTA
jgi:hypothetical protein